MEKIWLKSYAPGVPAVINPDAYQSIPELVADTCQRFHDSPAFYSMGVKPLLFLSLIPTAPHLLPICKAICILKKGDRVAIMLPNILQYPIVMLGILKAGW